jgi:hypothetical protein
VCTSLAFNISCSVKFAREHLHTHRISSPKVLSDIAQSISRHESAVRPVKIFTKLRISHETTVNANIYFPITCSALKAGLPALSIRAGKKLPWSETEPSIMVKLPKWKYSSGKAATRTTHKESETFDIEIHTTNSTTTLNQAQSSHAPTSSYYPPSPPPPLSPSRPASPPVHHASPSPPPSGTRACTSSTAGAGTSHPLTRSTVLSSPAGRSR